jgi:D-xylonolactonase
VRFPCANVTKPSFGGLDGRTLYVTTAAAGLNDVERAQQPQAGGLFEVRVQVPGPMSRAFDLAAGAAA